MTSEQLIKRYKKAYQAVNKKTISVDYYKGWYTLGAGCVTDKYRAKKLIEMCEVLEKRINLNA